MNPQLYIDSRPIGIDFPPLVIAEIGINHEGNLQKAIQMIDAVASAGGECVKFQCHIPEEEMIPNSIIPGNATESIWDLIQRCALSEPNEVFLKQYAEAKGLIYLSTPFSLAAVERLERLQVSAYKIGSGECNHLPLVKRIAQLKKPVLLSTGMNDLSTIFDAVKILRENQAPFALLHCTSMYPTPPSAVRLGALDELKKNFPDAVLGLSDHSTTIYPCIGAVPLGARVLERHFTIQKNWPGPDIPISMDPNELKELITASKIVFEACGGAKNILEGEKPTIQFAYASVTARKDLAPGEELTFENIDARRPGTGEIRAAELSKLIGRKITQKVRKGTQLHWNQISMP